MAKEYDVNGSFEVRRMSSSSFAIATIYFLIAFVFLTVYLFYSNSFFFLLGCIFFAGLGIYNAAKKHKNDEVFIEIDTTGIWVHSKELSTWDNYKGSYINIKYDSDYDNYSDRDLYNRNSRILQRVINIEFYKSNESGYFIHQLLFNGSEDKVEDEVIDAIEFYYSHQKNIARISI